MVAYNLVTVLFRDSIGGFDDGFTYAVCKGLIGLLIGDDLGELLTSLGGLL